MQSVNGRVWQFAGTAWRTGAALAGALGLHPTVAHILAARGYTDAASVQHFLSPRLDQLPDPSTLKDLDTAVARLVQALEKKERLGIFGDYDVDGTCATALLTRYLRAVGANPVLYIPDRLTEGYGPTPAAMEVLAAQGVQLLITVDTGISAHSALQRAAELGLEVIITDHHPPAAGLPLPPAVAIIDPMRADDVSGLTTLCGSAVAFYVLLGLNRALRQVGFFTAARPEPSVVKLLDLVAVATVADVMPLTGINRVLVARGLAQLATGQHAGLAALVQVAGADAATPTAHTAGFVLGPRLNAAGRIDSARAALNLLLADDMPTALPLAAQLDALNDARRTLEKSITAEALAQAAQLGHSQGPVLVLHHPSWHPGLVGIVASRVKEWAGRPCFVLGGDAQGHLKGSARSVPAINIGAAVQAARSVLLSGGGHAMAAGATLEPANLSAFIGALNAHATAQLQALPAYQPALPLPDQLASLLAVPLEVDAVLTLSALTPQLATQLNQLAPFGVGNPQPVLAIRQAQVVYARPVGAAAEHLKLTLRDGGVSLDAIAFGAMRSPLGEHLSRCAREKLPPVALAGTLHLNSWNGATKLDVQVADALTEPWATPLAHTQAA